MDLNCSLYWYRPIQYIHVLKAAELQIQLFNSILNACLTLFPTTLDDIVFDGAIIFAAGSTADMRKQTMSNGSVK